MPTIASTASSISVIVMCFAEELLGVAPGQFLEQLGVGDFIECFLTCHPAERSSADSQRFHRANCVCGIRV